MFFIRTNKIIISRPFGGDLACNLTCPDVMLTMTYQEHFWRSSLRQGQISGTDTEVVGKVVLLNLLYILLKDSFAPVVQTMVGPP